ncbi:MAG TPA: DciA family protein, partial [Candidatus Aquilonibacter sp.]
TLTIVTTSSVWSQQLSYLNDRLLESVRARLPKAGIEHLRFRVGKLPARGSRPRSTRVLQQGGGAAPPRPPAADAQEALARFRDSVDDAERAKRARGWKECSGCNALIAPGSPPLCVPCSIARGAERERLVSRLLYEAPWLGYAGTAELIEDLQRDEYDAIRRRLLQRWWDRLSRARWNGKLSRDGAERLIASSYVLLKSELAPERLTPAIVRNVLGDELHDLLYV